MKTTDPTLLRFTDALQAEAAWYRSRATELEGIAKDVKKAARSKEINPHTFEWAVQNAASIVTHRSNIYAETIFRNGAQLMAMAAVEWRERQPIVPGPPSE